MPLTRLAYRATTASNQPQRRSRPVVVPNSPPCLRRCSPLSSNSSVGNGPEPTRVVYALMMPMTRSIRVGADARADAGAAGGRVGRGDERIGAVVDVEQGGLRALEQHPVARVEGVAEQQPGVGDAGFSRSAYVGVLLDHLVDVDRLAVVDLDQDLVLLLQRALELLAEDRRVEQVLHADAHAGDLVAVRRADAAAGGADLARAEEPLGDLIQGPVVRHDQVRVGGDHAGVRCPRRARPGPRSRRAAPSGR